MEYSSLQELCVGFGFIEFEDKRDAEDALRAENGARFGDGHIVVEWAKASRRGTNECFKCGKEGHWARDCPDAGGRRRSRSRSRDRRRDRSRDRHSRRRSRSRSRSRDRRYVECISTRQF